jgi:hypothetical protein
MQPKLLRPTAPVGKQHSRKRLEIRARPPMHNHFRIVKQFAALEHGITSVSLASAPPK